MHKGRSSYPPRCTPGSRTCSTVDPGAVYYHRNANGGTRKEPLALDPKPAKTKKPPSHTRKAAQ
jgi:hypothetical protein